MKQLIKPVLAASLALMGAVAFADDSADQAQANADQSQAAANQSATSSADVDTARRVRGWYCELCRAVYWRQSADLYETERSHARV